MDCIYGLYLGKVGLYLKNPKRNYTCSGEGSHLLKTAHDHESESDNLTRSRDLLPQGVDENIPCRKWEMCGNAISQSRR